MTRQILLESIGYAASLLIAISMMMSSILRLRIFNSLGAAAFAVYGLLIHAFPVAVLNGFIVAVNFYYLLRLLRAKEYFQLLELKPGSVYLGYFLQFYEREITKILPDFRYQPVPGQLALFILRDCRPAGVLIAAQESDGVLRVHLVFLIPRYHDLKIGRFLFVEQENFFVGRGVREIVIAPRSWEFAEYLVRVGFEEGQAGGLFRIRYSERPG